MLYQLLLLGIIGRLVKADYCDGSDTIVLTEACECASSGGSNDCTVRFPFRLGSIIGSCFSWIVPGSKVLLTNYLF